MTESLKTLAKPLVVATHNPGKVNEIQDLLRPLGLDAVSALDLGLPDVEETGETFEANAALKAEAAARAAGRFALADDSGVAVDALGGAPGVISARWAEDPANPDAPRDFNRAMQRVWDELQAAGGGDRRARFVCVLALASPGVTAPTRLYRGEVEGHIVWPPRGGKGFGYDPIFVPTGGDLTFAEIEPAEKHAISHRARAFEKFLANLGRTGLGRAGG